MIGATIGIAPSTLTFLYVGVNIVSIQQLIEGKRAISPIEVAFFILSFAAVVFVVYWVTKKSKMELTKILQKEG